MAEGKYDPAQAKRVVVIGGGLSGLAAAHRIVERSEALRRPVEVVVLEAKDRVGGAIWTERRRRLHDRGRGRLVHHQQAVGRGSVPAGSGLGDQLIGTDPQHRRSFVVRKGRLVPVPEGFVLMAPNRLGPILTTPILSLRGKLRMLLDLVLPAPRRRRR